MGVSRVGVLPPERPRASQMTGCKGLYGTLYLMSSICLCSTIREAMNLTTRVNACAGWLREPKTAPEDAVQSHCRVPSDRQETLELPCNPIKRLPDSARVDGCGDRRQVRSFMAWWTPSAAASRSIGISFKCALTRGFMVNNRTGIGGTQGDSGSTKNFSMGR